MVFIKSTRQKKNHLYKITILLSIYPNILNLNNSLKYKINVNFN